MAEGQEIGALSGRIELEDRMSSTLDLLTEKINSFDQKFDGFGKHVASQAASFFTAEAALGAVREAAHLAIETLDQISVHGAKVANVTENFEHLTAGANRLGSTLIGALDEGLHDTVNSFNLMRLVNADLAAGMNLTDKQFKDIATGGFALAKAKGIDVQEAFEKINQAMLTGQVRGLKELGMKIDMASAEQIFADKINTTKDRLNEEGKIQAIREAILLKVTAATARLGDQTDSLDVKVIQASESYTDFMNDLGRSIATSDVVLNSFDAIRNILTEAFGSDREAAIKKITSGVESLSRVAVTGTKELLDVGHATVQFVTDYRSEIETLAVMLGTYYSASKLAAIGTELLGLVALTSGGQVTTFGLALGAVQAMDFTSLASAGVSMQLLGESAMTALGPLGLIVIAAGAIYASFKAANAETGWIREISDGFEYASLRVQGYSAAEADAMIATDHMVQKLKESGVQTKAAADATNTVADAHKNAGVAADAHSAAEDKAKYTLGMTADEAKKYAEALLEMVVAGKGWQGVLETIDGTTVEAIKYYLDAGIAQDKLAVAYGLTANQVKAVDESRKDEIANLKIETTAAEAVSKAYTKYYQDKANLTATDSQRAKNDAEADYEIHVSELQAKGVKDVTYYNAYWDLRNKDIALSGQQRLVDDSNSKANLDLKIAKLKDYYDFQMQNADQFKQADRDSTKEQIKNLTSLREHWNDVGHAISTDTEHVRTLSGEVLTLKEYEARQLSGGSYSYDLSSQKGIQEYKKLNPGAQINLSDSEIIAFIKGGGNLQQLIQQGSINPYGLWGKGGGLPGFALGGPTGQGGPAMLHPGEYVVPQDGTLVLSQSAQQVNPAEQSMVDRANATQAALLDASKAFASGAVSDWESLESKLVSAASEFKNALTSMDATSQAASAPDAHLQITTNLIVDGSVMARVVEDRVMDTSKGRRQFTGF